MNSLSRAAASDSTITALLKRKPDVLATVSPGVVLPERGAVPQYVWLMQAFANPGASNQESKVYQTSKKIVATDWLKAFIGSITKNKLPVAGGRKTADLLIRTEFYDQTGAGVIALYHQGRMYERWVESPAGLLGPRCSPFPRAPIDVVSGLSWPASGRIDSRIETRRGGKDDAFAGQLSVRERNAVVRSAKNLEGFRALLASGRVAAKIGGRGKSRLIVVSFGKKAPQGYRYLKGTQWAALVMGARSMPDAWAVGKSFDGYPILSDINVLVEHFGRQAGYDEALALPKSAGEGAPKTKAEPKVKADKPKTGPGARVKAPKPPKADKPKKRKVTVTKKADVKTKRPSGTRATGPRPSAVRHGARPTGRRPEPAQTQPTPPPIRGVRQGERRTGPGQTATRIRPPGVLVAPPHAPAPPAGGMDLASLLGNVIRDVL